jgi:hypothetical protein
MVEGTKNMRIKFTKLFGAVLGIALLMTAPAYAALSPTQDGYSDVAGRIQTQVHSTASGGGNGGGETLPFTGLTVGIVLAVALALIAAGLLVRRVSRPTA